MKKLNIILLLGLFFFAAAVFPSCKKEEITQVEYLVPLWKGSLASAPQNPEAGWAYYDTVKKQSFIFDGTSWQVMAQDGQNGQNGKDGKDGVDGQNGKDGKDGVDGKDGQNGLGLVWKGELEAAPSDAETNWAYYNSTEKKSFIYDGTTWLVLAKDGAQGEKGADGQNGKDGTNGTNGTDGGTSAGFVWKGELDANPSEPQTNWAYYNKTDKKAYVYDGEKWSILVQDGKDGENGTNGTNGENGNDGTIIVWKGSLTAAPASPAKGWCYYNSTEKKSYMYDGTTWQMIAQDGQNGTIIVWKGALETAPENPVTGWCYYNSTDKKSFMYDGTAWQMIAQDGKDAEPAEKVYAFTVDANNKKVAFSSGNLQYNKTEQKFQFAATQLEYLGTNSANDVIDLFCWGTGNNPTNTNAMETSFTDWGSKINDGKNWFTLSKDEWDYLINHNTKAWKTVNSVNGLVILPDGCTLNIANSDWATLAAAGAVFLPCGTQTYGIYWSSSPHPDDAEFAYYLIFDSDGFVGVYYNGRRLNGMSVRLVRSL